MRKRKAKFEEYLHANVPKKSRKTDAATLEQAVDGNKNLWNSLPKELIDRILDFTSIKVLGRLSQTSKILRDHVLNYIVSAVFSQRIKLAFRMHQNPITAPTFINAYFRAVGFSFKKSACSFPVVKRAALAQKFYALNVPRDLVTAKIIGGAFGVWISVFVNGWTAEELELFFKSLSSRIYIMVKKFLENIPGTFPKHEVSIRNFYRSLFLDRYCESHEEKNDAGFWLDLILHKRKPYFQAKLLYLLFGPEKDCLISWQSMVERKNDNWDVYRPLCEAIRSLQNISSRPERNRSSNEVLIILQELTRFPEKWKIQNMAYLLDGCGEDFSIGLILRLAKGDFMDESCRIFCGLMELSARNRTSTKWSIRHLVTVLQKISNADERTSFLFSLAECNHRNLQTTAVDSPLLPRYEYPY